MKILSLFDGIACGKVALERAGLQIDEYHACEIDRYAIKVSKQNHPDIIHHGDVTKYQVNTAFDLLIGGSPCQGFSFAGKQLAFDDPRSKLFFEYVRILKKCREYNPKIKFLLENVRMKKEYLDIISEQLGVEPVRIDSALVSAQSRVRYYWCNWKVTQPEDKGILLKDVVHKENIDLEKYKVPIKKNLILLDTAEKRRKIGYFGVDSQANRVYSIHNKAVTLCGEAGGGAAKMGQYLFGCVTQDRHGMRIDGYIRKPTPRECERLQTLFDNYTSGISEPQRYKCLGKCWTVDVIVHLVKEIK